MGYGSSAEEERMLSFSSKEMMTAPAPPQPSPNTMPTSHMPNANSNSAPSDTPLHNPFPSLLSNATTSRIVSYALQTWDERRPWTEFYSTRAISRPQFAALSDRFASNLHVYRANYQIIAAFWLLFVLLGSIQTLLVAALLFWLLERYCSFFASRNAGSLPQKHVVIAMFASLFIIWITGIGKFTVASLCLTSISVAAHAAFHEPQTIETEIV